MIHEKQIIIFFICVIAGAVASAATHAIKGRISQKEYMKMQRKRAFRQFLEYEKRKAVHEAMKKCEMGGYVPPVEPDRLVMLPPWPAGMLRPCLIDPKDNPTKAWFHRWTERSENIPPSPMIGGHSGGVLKYALALVEFEDGHVREVAPERVKFTDTEIRDCYFPGKMRKRGKEHGEEEKEPGKRE